MKIKILTIGKTDEAYLKEGVKKYLNRLKHYIQVELIELPDVKQGKKTTPEQLKEAEGKMLLQKIEHNDQVVLLDEKGKEFTSVGFSKYLQKKMNMSTANLVLIIGGPFGFSEEIYQRAQEKICLSRMTFSHQMVRLFLTEQLYRGFTILRGEKYHHE
ncbi:23S rRNA (pseudouridine(1915)-N(3))-methyltransferase RlmH [Cytophagaceae bacterium ABcell3]|nr:23S rRNA (pseudouridine(1915)-N(3))-methyltransferase RlmH [Cytophagaceae bacterium ABcell3]